MSTRLRSFWSVALLYLYLLQHTIVQYYNLAYNIYQLSRPVQAPLPLWAYIACIDNNIDAEKIVFALPLYHMAQDCAE